MKLTLTSVQYDTFDIDFQKLFDFMKNEDELENTVYDYVTQFNDNVDYYLEKVYGIVISYKDVNDCDCDEATEKKEYPYSINEYVYDNLDNGYYAWLEENKDTLGLTED